MNEEKGYILLEGVIAMAIFAIAMLGVIGLQINSIHTDGETSRKDAAVQLLNTATALVECSSFDDTSFSSAVFKDDVTPDNFAEKVRDEDEAISSPWVTSRDGKAQVYMRFKSTVNTEPVQMKTVYLVSAWNGLKSEEIHTLTRIMPKVENFMQ